jgi:putative ABC transport system permease protein
VNLIQLVIKNMRQRALSTWLTLLSVTLGVGMAIAIIVMGRETNALFGQNSFGFDTLVGAKASTLQLTINTIYHLDQSPGNIPFETYGRLLKGGDLYRYAKLAVPTVVGDTYQGIYRIVGTLPSLFGYANDGSGALLAPDDVLEYKPGEHYQIAEGRVLQPDKFEAVIGSDIPRLTDLNLGSIFQATHGTAQPGMQADIHAEKWTVVGVLAPTHTAADKVVYIALNSFYTIAAHGVGLNARYALRTGQGLPMVGGADAEDNITFDKDGTEHHLNYDLTPDKVIRLHPDLASKLALSAILVQSRGGDSEMNIEYILKNDGSDVMACNPASVMRDFFNTFLKPSKTMLLLICSLVTVVAAVGILVSIYNSVSARTREIAILRALGATRARILALICAEAGLVALIGAFLGIIAGHLITWAGSAIMYEQFGESLNWWKPDLTEPAYLAGVILLALLAGLVPALKAYRTPVATNLVAA